MTNQRAWMRLPSGRRLDLLNPDPNAWNDEDLSTRLSRTYRWGGESSWPLPLSVAQHSLLVLEVRRAHVVKPLDAVQALQELLHDAEEGFLGFDCISPLKRGLGKPFADIEERLSQAIRQRYRLPNWTSETHYLHKQADHIAAACEAVHCVGWTIDEARDVLGISADILKTDPLAEKYGETPWAPWPAKVAADRFLETLTSLMDDHNCCQAVNTIGRIKSLAEACAQSSR